MTDSSSTAPTFQVRSPANGEALGEYTGLTPDETIQALDNAHTAYLSWRKTPFSKRSALLRAVASKLRDQTQSLVELMADEMGKPVTDGRSEVEKCAWVCEFYADNAERFLASETIDTDAMHSFVAYRPMGVVLAVMPWNFPLWQVFRFAAPTLMAGNGGVLKHASNVPGCALAIERLFAEAGAPKDLFQTLLIPSDAVEAVIAHDAVVAATLTGSTPAGRAVASCAGHHLKKTVLELGGSDPYLVLADADLEAAAEACVTSRLVNSGQSCIGAKRFIVVREVHDAFVGHFVTKMKEAVMGDPRDDETTIGPQARQDLRDELHEQVTKTISAGAKLLLGGRIPDGPGAFYPPTVLTHVEPGMPAFDEEIFGPVAAIVAADDEAHAVELANQSVFGLGAAVFTENLDRGRDIAEYELEAGACFVNAYVRSDPRLPFGGIKTSGYGRELAANGIRAFANVKTVYIADPNEGDS